MEIKNFKKLRDNRYKIIFINDQEIILYDDIILKYNLLLTKKIEKKELIKIKKENKSLECYYKAIKYLGIKNRCQKEIENYLKKLSYSKEEINNTIYSLEKHGYLNNDNYITSFINDQINLTNNGPAKIKRKLIDLGFNEDEINEKLNKIGEEVWNKKLEKIIIKKVSSNKKDSENKIKEKILYNCINEGYQKSAILEILDSIQYPKNINALEKEINRLYKKLEKKYNNYELEYQIKGRLLKKGFLKADIEYCLEQLKKACN